MHSLWASSRSTFFRSLGIYWMWNHDLITSAGINAKLEEIISMMTSSNGNIFRVTGPLCGEFTGLGEFPTQRPVTSSFDVFFDLRLNKRLSKQPWGWRFETPSWPLWRHCNAENHHKPSRWMFKHTVNAYISVVCIVQRALTHWPWDIWMKL